MTAPSPSAGNDGGLRDADAPVTPVLTKKQAQRANSSVVGMLIALGISLLLILPVMLLVPQKKTETFERRVNVAAVATQAGHSMGFKPAAPALGEDYPSNHADMSAGGQSKVPTWTVGYITPSKTYLQFIQTNKANDTWVAQTVNGPKVDSRTIEGLTWDVYTSSKNEQTWVSVREGNTYLISGEASDEDKAKLAAALAATDPSLPAATTPTPTPSPSAS